MKNDGTRCYYYEPAELGALVAEAGFVDVEVTPIVRELTNRKRQMTMCRHWVQVIARKPVEA